MNSKVIMALAAAAALASCAKNEVAPVSAPEQEISYQTVTGPNTKAATQYSFSEDNVFVSYAYRLDGDKIWPKDLQDAALYVGKEENGVYTGVTVGYEEGTPAGEHKGVWRSITADRYYWPDNGSLTFFAWSNNKKNGDENASKLVSGTVSCPKEHGITVSGYDAGDNKNFDFMVAVPQPNMKANGTMYGYNGVPTLFKHKMCQVRYSVRTNVTYSITKFWINSLTLKNIHQVADFMYSNNNVENDFPWSPVGDGTDCAYKSSEVGEMSGENKLTQEKYPAETHWVEDCVDQYYFIPQEFTSDEQVLRIEYTVKTGNADATKYYAEKKLSEIFPDGWKKNKKYTIDIVLGLNEVLWDPAIEDWETGNVSGGDWSLIGPGTPVANN